MTYNEAIKEAKAIRADYEENKITNNEVKEAFYLLSEESGISYDELIAESL